MHPEASPCRSRWSRALSLPGGDVRPLLLGLLLLAARTPDAARAQPPGGDPPPLSCGGTFDATADATVIEADPAGNHGTGPIFVSANAGGEQIGLVSFDPGPAFPRDTTVYQARLEMTLFEIAAPSDAFLEVRTTDEVWGEATVTWDSRPLPLPTAAEMPLDRPPGQVVAADVTTLFRRWQQQGGATFDVVLSMPEPGQASFFEHGVVGQPPGPRLVVSCAPVPEPAPIDPTTGDVAQQAGIALLESLSTAPVTLRIERGAVRFASFDVPVPAGVGRNRDAQAAWFLDQFSGLLRTPAAEDQWQLVRREPSLGAVFFRQLHRGVPVESAGLAVYFADGSVRKAKSLGGAYVSGIETPPEPRLTAIDAEGIALALAAATESEAPKLAGETKLVYFDRLLFGYESPGTFLTFEVHTIGPGGLVDRFIDASSGQLRHERRHEQEAYDLEIRDHGGVATSDVDCWGQSIPLVYTEGGGVQPNPSADATEAFGHIGAIYGTWKTWFGRDSLDGAGRQLKLHVGYPFSPSNASWYGPCQYLHFSPQWAKRDIVGHEYGHGVIDYSSQLEYLFQSGALNESFADIAGRFVDAGDWLVGEDLPGGALRNMSDPPAFQQPDRLSGYQAVPVGNDSGGVHTNSGIQNKAAYLLTDGGLFNGRTVAGIGSAKANFLFYATMTGLVPTSGFLDARNRAVWLAQAFSNWLPVLGFTAADVCSVRNAYAAVEVGSGDVNCDGIEDDLEIDSDGDGVPNSIDNCIGVANPSQANHDNDSAGDACDDDDDNDGVLDGVDNCPLAKNADQYDDDGDGIGWVCDDSDGDGAFDSWDNCPGLYNPGQKDSDGDAFNVFPFPGGDACDPDDDNDTVLDVLDNCPLRKNVDQLDSDDDSLGDVCDLCPFVQSSDNADFDHDGKGDPCDPDADGDGVLNAFDNCPLLPNPDQADNDQNGVGFACDPEEQSATARGLVRRSSYQISQQAALRIPIPVCASCGAGPLAPGYELGVVIGAPVGLFARIVDSNGIAVDSDVEARPTHAFRLRPPAFGGTGWALAGGSAPAPEGDPAGRIRHYLEIYPGPDTPAGEPVALSITLSETLFADGFEGGDAALWSATAP